MSARFPDKAEDAPGALNADFGVIDGSEKLDCRGYGAGKLSRCLPSITSGVDLSICKSGSVRVFSTLAVICISVPLSAQEVGFPEVEGWSVASEVHSYTADNLWEYINGAAELFVEYDVQTCYTGDLASGGLVVTVDYYDMGTPLNAFGVYVRERPDPGIEIVGATEALISPPYQALLLKGRLKS